MELEDIKVIIQENTRNNESSQNYDIEIFDLTKKYQLKGTKKSILALDKINLKVRKGEIFGLLGPNGAGKTTMVSILTTLLQPTSGYATINGHNILKEAWFVKENTGLMLGGDMIYHRLTGYKNLKFFCKLYGIKNYKELINSWAKKFQLENWLNQYVSKYSKGMRLKLTLMRVLLINPKILFLDEPMLGLDPNSTVEVIEILKNLKKTIFLTSHQMHVVSELCDRIAFLKEGKIINIDTQDNFKKLISEKIKIQLKVAKNKSQLISNLNKLDFVDKIEDINDEIRFFINDEKCFPILFNFLKDYPIINFNELKPTLNDVFISLSK